MQNFEALSVPARGLVHTGRFVPNADAAYAGECDPITQKPWNAVQRPVLLRADPTHFYEWTPRVQALERNPWTQTAIRGINDWEPIVHPGTRYADYAELVRDLARNGWNGEACVQHDLRALRRFDREHELAEEADVFWAKQQEWLQGEREMRGLDSLRRFRQRTPRS